MPATTSEPDQPIRLALWIGGVLRRVELRATVWGAHAQARPSGAGVDRVGRAKYGAREFSVVWSEAEGVWSHGETRMQYDPNEQSE